MRFLIFILLSGCTLTVELKKKDGDLEKVLASHAQAIQAIANEVEKLKKPGEK